LTIADRIKNASQISFDGTAQSESTGYRQNADMTCAVLDYCVEAVMLTEIVCQPVFEAFALSDIQRKPMVIGKRRTKDIDAGDGEELRPNGPELKLILPAARSCPFDKRHLRAGLFEGSAQ
jgi:hypothetical protein